MDATFAGGSAWGVPVAGAIVTVTAADVAAVLSAASGLAVATLSVGALGLGLGLVGTYLSRNIRDDALPLNVLSRIHTDARDFRGVCSSTEFNIRSDGNKLSIPIQYVHRIRYHNGFISNSETVVELMDGSRYRIDQSEPLEFLTLIGVQRVPLANWVSVAGCTIAEADSFKRDLVTFMNREKKSLFDILGADVMERFFPKHP
jgi:hypothetical protein